MRKTARAALLTAAAVVLASATAAQAADPLVPSGRWTLPGVGTAPTPPMGWNSWNAFALEISEAKILGSAQALLDTGLARAGYTQVNVDDGWWQNRRSADGRLQVRVNVFPSANIGGGQGTSLRPFTDRLHAMGLRAGIYSDIGRNACSQTGPDALGPTLPTGSVADREIGLYGHVAQDVQTFFGDWNFDYVKVDGCGIANYGADHPTVRTGQFRALSPLIDFDEVTRTDIPAVRGLYAAVRDAIAAVRPRRDYVYSLCLWGSADVRRWGEDVGTMWRTSGDINTSWGSMLHNFDTVSTREFFAGPGRWNDPDMLEVGNGFFDADHLVQARAHMGLWAITAAPLIIGTDLGHVAPAILDILRAPEVVAVDQDKAGNQGTLAYADDERQILVKTLADGRKAVALVNRTAMPTTATLTAAHLKLSDKSPIAVRDLWARRDLAAFTGEHGFPLAPYETLLLAVSGTPLVPGYYLSEQPARVHVAVDGIAVPTPDPTILLTRRPEEATTGHGQGPVYAGWGAPRADWTPYSKPLRLAGRAYASGIGVLAGSRLEVQPATDARRFAATVGIDDSSAPGSAAAVFELYGDGRRLATSQAKRAGDAPEELAADVGGVKLLELVVRATGAGPQPLVAAWGDARLLR